MDIRGASGPAVSASPRLTLSRRCPREGVRDLPTTSSTRAYEPQGGGGRCACRPREPLGNAQHGAEFGGEEERSPAGKRVNLVNEAKRRPPRRYEALRPAAGWARFSCGSPAIGARSTLANDAKTAGLFDESFLREARGSPGPETRPPYLEVAVRQRGVGARHRAHHVNTQMAQPAAGGVEVRFFNGSRAAGGGATSFGDRDGHGPFGNHDLAWLRRQPAGPTARCASAGRDEAPWFVLQPCGGPAASREILIGAHARPRWANAVPFPYMSAQGDRPSGSVPWPGPLRVTFVGGSLGWEAVLPRRSTAAERCGTRCGRRGCRHGLMGLRLPRRLDTLRLEEGLPPCWARGHHARRDAVRGPGLGGSVVRKDKDGGFRRAARRCSSRRR